MASRRAANVMPQQPAEWFVADDVFQAKILNGRRRWQVDVDQHIAETLMRSELVVVGEPTREEMLQVVFTENDEMVQDFMLGALHPGFGKGVHVRWACRNRTELDAVRL